MIVVAVSEQQMRQPLSRAFPATLPPELPVRNGSMRIFAAPLSTRNAEWPYQVIFTGAPSVSIYDWGKDRTTLMQVKATARVIATVEQLPALLASGGTLAGIDLGDKTIGLAISDRGFAFAHPRPVIMRRNSRSMPQPWSTPCRRRMRAPW